MNDDVVNEILNDSDAVCPCGADPRFTGSLVGWFFDIEQVAEWELGGPVLHEEAVVRCPRCA